MISRCPNCLNFVGSSLRPCECTEAERHAFNVKMRRISESYARAFAPTSEGTTDYYHSLRSGSFNNLGWFGGKLNPVWLVGE